jgi:riboflavin kinase/FMN adenylyltransferase
MKIIHYRKIPPLSQQLVLGIGKFDGFHLGHQKIVRTIVRRAHETRRLPAVFTFRHFPGNSKLATWQDKSRFFRQAGLVLCLWSDFEEISFWEPGKFVDFLVRIGVRKIIIGSNFRFGTHRQGSPGFLRRAGREQGFSVTVIQPVRLGRTIVSSTGIRQHLGAGNITAANRLLGRPFSFSGRVITGKSRGRLLDFPTANLYPFCSVEIGDGVYAGWVLRYRKFHRAVLNIGPVPTFHEEERRIEVHILNFHQDIYGETLRVFLVRKLRPEIRFSSVQRLKEQISKDIHHAFRLLKNIPDGR